MGDLDEFFERVGRQSTATPQFSRCEAPGCRHVRTSGKGGYICNQCGQLVAVCRCDGRRGKECFGITGCRLIGLNCGPGR